MPNLVLNQEKLEGVKPVAGNALYELKFLGFKPATSSKKTSVNYNAMFEILGHQDSSGKPMTLQATANSQIDSWFQEMCHGLGLPLEETPTGPKIPGTFTGPDDILKASEWKYTGPLVGRTCKAELVETSYQGRSRNEIKQFICAVPQCGQRFPKIRHSTNLIGKGK